MQDSLVKKLHLYISINNPDLLFVLEQEGKVTEYLTDKVKILLDNTSTTNENLPGYIVEDNCMEILTAELKPSRYHYIKELFEKEFEQEFKLLNNTPALQTELINMVNYCREVFDEIGFSEENEDSAFLMYNIIGAISEYLGSNSEKEKVDNELQQQTAFTP